MDINAIYSLARANGWGSAGKCPASRLAKTPAVQAEVSRVAAGGAAANAPLTAPTYGPGSRQLVEVSGNE